jgi:hypothetical protein
MTRFVNLIGAALLAAWAGSVAPAARADTILEQYEFQGLSGSETSLAPSFVASGLTGNNVTESAVLTPSAGNNSMNSSGWNLAGANYSLGFAIQPGSAVTVDQLILTSRSSATGPGFIDVEASVDGGAFHTVATITQTSTNFNDEFLAITPVTATKSLTFEFVAANQTSAAGGTIGSAGTFRIGDFNPAGTPTAFTLNGTVVPLAAAVPEPPAGVLTALGLAGVGIVALSARRRAGPAVPSRV